MVFPRDKSITHVEQLKTDYDWLMRVMHRALRRWRTGGADIARVLKEDDVLFLNRFNPGNLDHAPNLWLFLTTVEYMESREVVSAVASLAHCIAVPDLARERHRSEGQLISDVHADLAECERLLERVVAERGSMTKEAARLALTRLVSDAHLLAQRLAGRPA